MLNVFYCVILNGDFYSLKWAVNRNTVYTLNPSPHSMLWRAPSFWHLIRREVPLDRGPGAGWMWQQPTLWSIPTGMCLCNYTFYVYAVCSVHSAILKSTIYHIPYQTSNYWLLPNDVVDEGITFDFGCTKTVTGFDIRNTNNYQYSDRYVTDEQTKKKLILLYRALKKIQGNYKRSFVIFHFLAPIKPTLWTPFI